MTTPSLWLALACHEPTTPGTDPPDDTPVDSPSIPIARIDEDHPTVVHVTWTTEEPVTGWVEFGLDGELDRTSPPAGPTREHAHQLLALKVGHRYSWRT